MLRSKLYAFASASLGVLAVAGAAQAAGSEGAPATVEEVIVTATLRSENLQQVPIAVTAVTGSTLEKAGVSSVANFASVAPSFQVNNSQTNTQGTTIRVRGVGTTGNNTGLESAVAVFLDGVYLSRPGIALNDLLDVEQIELLRGPQGTLFGRNTSAGALSIKTKAPNLSSFEGFANATYGNYDLVSLQGGVSGPIIQDKLAARVSGAYRKRDGWLINSAGHDDHSIDHVLVRGQLLWEINPSASLRLIADYSDADDDCCDAVIGRESSYAALGFFAANGLPANGGVSVSGPAAVEHRRSANNYPFRDRLEQRGLSSELNWDIGDGKLTWIMGYRMAKARTEQEADFTSVNVFSNSVGTSVAAPGTIPSTTKIRTFTQELRYAGSAFDGKFDYLVGGYYADEDIYEVQTQSLGPDHQAYVSAALTSLGIPGVNPARNIFAGGVSSAGSFAANGFSQDGRNWSLFTNNTIHLTDRFAFNFGLRYSNDKKHGAFDQLAASSPACAAVISRGPLLPASLQPLAPLAQALTCFPFATAVGQGPTEFDRVYKDEQLVYTAKLTGEMMEDVNGYVSFSHGYKAGGFNLDPTAAIGGADPRFDPEKVDSYEIGIKSRLFDRRVTANLAVFHQELEDFQVLEFTGVQFKTFNVAQAKSTGFELELSGRVAEGLNLNGGATYADARYPKNCGGATSSVTVTRLCGNQLTNAPKWVLVGGFDWSHPVGDGMTVSLAGQARYESDRRTETQALLSVAAGTGTEGPGLSLIPSPLDVQKANTKVNLRAALSGKDDRWAVEVWGVNIFNEQTVGATANTPLRGVSSLPGPANAGGISQAKVQFLQDPRTYGVTLRTKF